MLDPMLGKILTAKQAAESPPTAVDPLSNNLSLETQQETKDSSTPAEIRLVVKFIVEEHTVYKGIVRKIKQLESEELSRVVSHIAWDGAKEIDKASLEGETDETSSSTKATPEVFDKSPQTSSDRIDGSNDGKLKEQSIFPPDSKHATDDLLCEQNDISECLSKELPVQEMSESNNETSDHKAYVKCSSTQSRLEENTVAQNATEQEITKLDLVVDCDMNREQSSSLFETDNKQSSSQEEHEPSISNMIEEKPSERFVDDTLTNKHSGSGNANSSKFSDPINDIDGDSQSVTEALNDCVMNVALEYKRHDKNSSSSCHEKFAEEIWAPETELKQLFVSSVVRHDCQESFQAKDPIVDPATEDMIDLVNDKLPSITDGVLQDFSREKSVKSNQALATNTNNTNSSQPHVPLKSATIHQIKEDASCSIVKRKAPSIDQNHSTGKRIRRASNHREQRSSLNTRKSANKTLENASTKQNLPLDVTGTSTSPTTMNQPPQVFAKWSDNHFYPGYIIKQVKDRKFVISFLDGAQKDVAETDLIPLCNIISKQVRVTIAKNYCYNAIVHEQAPPLNDQPQFDVEYQSNSGSTRRCVSWKDIFLTAEQGTPLINQVDKISGASNFADVDLDNIIYEKRSRRIQDMEEFYFTGSSPHRTKTSLLL